MLGFTGLEDPPQGSNNFVQKDPGTFKDGKPIRKTRIDEDLLKCYYINGSTVSGVREPFLVSFALDEPTVQNTYIKNLELLFFEKINKTVLFHINL